MKPMTFIESAFNETIKRYRALLSQNKQRTVESKTVIEGIVLIEAYVASGKTPRSILISKKFSENEDILQRITHINCPVSYCNEDLYEKVRSLGPGQDIMAMIDIQEPQMNVSDMADALILENIQDAGNVGTLLRSAASAGVRDIYCTTGTASPWSPKVLRAGMGAQFSLNIIEHVSLDMIHSQTKTTMYCTDPRAAQTLYQTDLTAPCMWLVGNEGQGVSEAARQIATAVSIPQPGGQESLNVAVAGSICLFEMVRQRISV